MPASSAIDAGKVAIYIRWSTEDQGEGTTLAVQSERCQYFLASQGWTFRSDLVYVDDGYSGGSLDRPALTRLRADVQAGHVACVVVYKIDRLSRSVVDMVDLVLREWEGRCFVKSASEEVNTISPAGKMFFYILVSFAEYERNVIRERTMGGKVKRAEQGLNPGFRPPYGYVTGPIPGTFQVVAEEAATVRRIFDMYRQGNGSHAIAAMLNREGSRRRGSLWSDLMIRRILSQGAYIGVLAYGWTTRTSKSQRERDGLGTVIRHAEPRFGRREGAFPVIIDRPVWDEVQRLLQARKESHRHQKQRPTYSAYLLTGVARCRCGGAIVGGRAQQHAYYSCGNRKRRGGSLCDAGYIPAGIIDREIEQRVKERIAGALSQLLTQTSQQERQARTAELQAALAGARARQRALRERGARLAQDYRQGDLPAHLYARELAAVESDTAAARARIETLKGALAELRTAGAAGPATAQARNTAPDGVNADHAWAAMTVPERKELLRRLTASVVLYRPVHTDQPPVLALEWVL